ncbi:porin [Prevotella amnii]|uniref:OprO/OprP family phosphate-selective porin n=1 Tax=Prevotella amnii TaxID=419005 RepID=UPI00336AD63A
MKRNIAIAICGLLVSTSTFAQKESKLETKVSGRILIDAGIMKNNNEELNKKLNNGAAIPDARVGFSARYGKWKAKVDIGYARQKLSLKDINIDYNFNKENLVRAGYFVHQFGLQSATSSSFKISMEEPEANQAFFNSRLLGAMFVHSGDKIHATASLFAENDAMKNSTDKIGNEAWGVMTRFVYRPFTQRGKLFHVGVSGAFETPRYNSDEKLNHKSYTLKASFPTRIANVEVQKATIGNAKNLWKISPEFTAAYGNFGVEGQYFYVNITRNKEMPNYHAYGAYTNLRFLVKGNGYTYTKSDAGIATPDPGSMELVAGYNYSTLTDNKANIRGGKVNDYSLTFNYYINKYMIWRVRGSITRATDNDAFKDNTFSILETRLQFKF